MVCNGLFEQTPQSTADARRHHPTRRLKVFGEVEVGETRLSIGTGVAGEIPHRTNRAVAANPVAANPVAVTVAVESEGERVSDSASLSTLGTSRPDARFGYASGRVTAAVLGLPGRRGDAESTSPGIDYVGTRRVRTMGDRPPVRGASWGVTQARVSEI